MKILVLTILLLQVYVSFAASEMKILLQQNEVRQGSIVSAVLELNPEAVQHFELQKLKGKNLADTVYLMNAAPLLRKEGHFTADAQIIFAKVPEASPLVHKDGQAELLISWAGVKVTPIESTKGYLFGNFDVPARKKILIWILSTLAVIFGIIFTLKYRQKLKEKKERKLVLQKMKANLMEAGSYEDVVKLWQKKNEFLAVFPHTAEPLKELEAVLFKYQFKPRQNEVEKEEVLAAYRHFRDRITGGFHGV